MGFVKKHSFFIGLFLMFAIMLMPTPDGLSVAGKNALGVFIFALFVWLFRPYAEAASSLLIMVFLILFKVIDRNTVFVCFGSDTNYLVLSGLLISIAMAKTGFAKRLALNIIIKVGKKSSYLLAALMAVNLFVAFLMPSGTARMTLFLPIAMSIILAYGVKQGEKSNIAKQVMLTLPATDHLSTSTILTATGSNILAIEILEKSTNTEIFYSDWLIWSIVPNLILMFLWWVMIRKLFPEEEKSIDLHNFKSELKELGSIKKSEYKIISIFSLTVILWITDRWTGLNPALVALIGASLLFVPYLGILEWKEDNKKINYGLLIFNAAAIAVGVSLGKTKAADWAVNGLFNRFNFEALNPYIVLTLVLIITLVIICMTSSKTGRITMMVPVLIGIAATLKLNPAFLVMAFVFFNAYHFIFPFNAKSNLIYYGSGYIETKDMAVSGIIISLLCILVIVLTAIFYWPLVGLSPFLN